MVKPDCKRDGINVKETMSAANENIASEKMGGEQCPILYLNTIESSWSAAIPLFPF
jgi:hypothetical protein